MRVAFLADFPVHTLPGFEDRPSGHHATWLPPLAGELESYTTNNEIHWITCTKDITTPLTLRAWNQTFHLIPRHRLSVEMLTAFRRERRLIARLLQEIQPDLVHAWGTEQGYGYAANDFPGPSIISLQGILQSYCKAAKMPWLTRIQAIHEARVLRRAKHLTVESPWGASELRQLAPKAEINLLEYGAHPACFQIQRSLVEKPLALFVGSLSVLKGVDTLLTAFSDSRMANIDLIALGGGSPEFFHHPLPPNIRLLGHRSPDEVREWMSKAWCLVHPTRADTSPNCVKEARVIGLPVVTTPCGGQTQYVSHGKSGIIHPAGDVEALIQGVLNVTQSQETSVEMGTSGQAECRAALTPAATAKRLLEIYHR